MLHISIGKGRKLFIYQTFILDSRVFAVEYSSEHSGESLLNDQELETFPSGQHSRYQARNNVSASETSTSYESSSTSAAITSIPHAESSPTTGSSSLALTSSGNGISMFQGYCLNALCLLTSSRLLYSTNSSVVIKILFHL